ncbi:MAG: phosphodiester glycosidase family protein [Anaerolineales bacterium]|nr:phosphodiester glycosidase family protein [Anaerolineales bacterium]
MQPFTKIPRVLLVISTLILISFACATMTGGDAQPQSSTEQLYPGVTYIKEVRTSPRRMVVHIVKINMAKGNIQPLVTPPDRPDGGQPYNARTTTEFAQQNNVQIAINGSGFTPWFDYKLIYFPHSGDKVAPIGPVVSQNFSFLVNEEQKAPMLMFNGKRPVDISYILGNATYAISGTRMLVNDGQVEPGLNNFSVDPRSAAGVDNTGQQLILVVVDGRQSGYSKGATLQELAQILIDHGADKALELDGGGSSTLVLNRRDSAPIVLNSPIHQGIPGNQRPVATHIGIFVK